MSYWRNAGLTYLQFSRLAAATVRNAVKEEKKGDAIRATSTLKKIATAAKQMDDQKPPPVPLTCPPSFGLIQERRFASERLTELITRLRKEMISLRQMDLTLFCHLNTLRQSIALCQEAMSPDYPDDDVPYRNGLESSL